MAATITLTVDVRERTGTGGARAARNAGLVPAILYGGPRGPVPITLKLNEVSKAIKSGKFLAHLVEIDYKGERQPVIPRDVQYHPVTETPLHIDLYRVEEHQLIKIAVPVRFLHADTCPGVKRGGTLNVVRHDVEIWAPADEIPDHLEIDLAAAEIGAALRWSDVRSNAKIEPVIKDRDFVIATIASRGGPQGGDATETPATA